MTQLTINKIGDKISFEELVSSKTNYLNKIMYIYMFDGNTNELHIAIKNEETEMLEATEKISLALGIEIFLEKLEGYGFEVVVKQGFCYSIETVSKVQGLIQAGFSKLIRLDNNYMVDNIFQQNILLEQELKDLLESNISEINLSEIK